MNCFHISIIYNMINIPELIRAGFIEAFCLIPLLHWLISRGQSSIVVNPILRTVVKKMHTTKTKPTRGQFADGQFQLVIKGMKR